MNPLFRASRNTHFIRENKWRANLRLRFGREIPSFLRVGLKCSTVAEKLPA